MPRGLYAICSECAKPIEAIDVHKASPSRIAALVRKAERGGGELNLSAENLTVGCECARANRVQAGELPDKPHASRRRRISIRQIFFIMTVVAVLLAIFRHPIQLMLDARVWQAAVAPWSVYAWLLWGGQLTQPPDLKSSPMVAIAFTISTPLAVLAAFFGGWAILRTILLLWHRIAE